MCEKSDRAAVQQTACSWLAYLIIAYFLANWGLCLHAQTAGIGYAVIKNYDQKTYQANAQNWSVTANKAGILYFANLNGLLEFDGSKWRTYPLPEKNALRDVQCSGDTIYVAASKEFGYFTPDRQGELHYTSLKHLLPSDLQKNLGHVWRVHALPKEWVFQSESHIFRWKNKQLLWNKAAGTLKFSSKIDDAVILQNLEQGLFRYQNGQLTALPNTAQLKNQEVWSCLPLNDHEWLVVTLTDGVQVYDQTKLRPWNTPASQFLIDYSSLGGIRLRNGLFLFNSILNGYIIADANGEIVQHVNRKKGLLNDTVLRSYESDSGQLWLAMDNGISQVNRNSLYDVIESSHDLGSVYDLVHVHNRLYAATNKGLYYTPWDGKGPLEEFEFVPQTNGQVWKLEVVQGELYVCHNRKLLHIDQQLRVNQILEHGTWKIWPTNTQKNRFIANTYHGLFVLEVGSNGILASKNQVTGFNESERKMVYTNGNAFVIRDKQLLRYQLSPDLTRVIRINKLSHAEALDSGFDEINWFQNQVLTSVGQQLYTWQFPEQKLVPHTQWSSLMAHYSPPTTWVQDRNGNVWFKYGDQFGLLQLLNGQFKDRTAELSEMKGRTVTQQLAVWPIDENRTLLGVNTGIIELNLAYSSVPVAPRQPLIREIEYGSTRYRWVSRPNSNQKLKIPYSANNLLLSYTVPEGQTVLYSYRIPALSEQWSEWSTANEQWINHLPAGNFLFEVRAKNEAGIVSQITRLEWVILPPWYFSTWAYIGYVILFGLSTFLLYRLVKKRIQLNRDLAVQRELKEFLHHQQAVRQRQQELEEEIERLRNETEKHNRIP